MKDSHRNPQSMVEQVLDHCEATGTDQLAALGEILAEELEDYAAWTDRLQVLIDQLAEPSTDLHEQRT